MIKKICILGSTGSIGRQTLDVIRTKPLDFKVEALSAGKNIELLVEQIKEFSPKIVSVLSLKEADQLKTLLGQSFKVEILYGEEGLKEIVKSNDCDMVVVAVVGIAGLLPTLEAIRAGKNIALANKETLVAGGSIVMPEARKYGVKILPVDSEHSAIFQCIANNSSKTIRRILITASGGPFRTWEKRHINFATLDQALAHPNWNMGTKVTIDSATLMNKALEILEAKWIFDIDLDQIEVLIHPQSIVHSMVEFIDGSVIAQLSNPTMHLPIQYALSYPERIKTDLVKPLKLNNIGKLEFHPPDVDKFPCLNLAYKVGKSDGTFPAVMNAANEIAVNAYVKAKITFYDIYRIVNDCISAHDSISNPTLEDVLEADRWARSYVEEKLLKRI